MQFLDVISVNVWAIIASLCNLLVIAWIVKRFLFKPVKKIFDARRAAIDGDYEKAREAREAAEESRLNYEAAMAAAQQTSEQIISVNLPQILISLCNLLVLTLIVKHFVYKPVKKVLAARRASTTFLTGLKRKRLMIHAKISRFAREARIAQILTEITSKLNICALSDYLIASFRIPVKIPGATKISRIATIRPYRPVVSAIAQPMIIVEVTSLLHSGWRPMASQALATALPSPIPGPIPAIIAHPAPSPSSPSMIPIASSNMFVSSVFGPYAAVFWISGLFCFFLRAFQSSHGTAPATFSIVSMAKMKACIRPLNTSK